MNPQEVPSAVLPLMCTYLCSSSRAEASVLMERELLNKLAPSLKRYMLLFLPVTFPRGSRLEAGSTYPDPRSIYH